MRFACGLPRHETSNPSNTHALWQPTVAKDVVETAVRIHGHPQLRY
jgi:hypothetical protein